MRITIKNGSAYYFANVSPEWAKRHDNGALISCGLTVGESLTGRSFAKLEAAGRVRPIDHDTYNHSGCQSRCKLRGDDMCQW